MRWTDVAWQRGDGAVARGYEIHHGVTTRGEGASELLRDGLGFAQGSVRGVYLHGLLEDTAYRQPFLEDLGWRGRCADWAARIDAAIERVAALIPASGWARLGEARGAPVSELVDPRGQPLGSSNLPPSADSR